MRDVTSTSEVLADGSTSYDAQPSMNNAKPSYMILDVNADAASHSNVQFLPDASTDELLQEYLATLIATSNITEDHVYQELLQDLQASFVERKEREFFHKFIYG